MAGDDKDQKTHDPTDKRLADARKRGDVATAPEMRHAIMFLAMLTVCGTLGAVAFARLAQTFVSLLGNADDIMLEPKGAQQFATGFFGEVALSLLPVLGVLFVFALLILFGQGRPTLSWTRVKPNWSKLSPVSGLGRMFGPRGLIEFAKTLAKFALVASVAVGVVWPKAVALNQTVGMEPLAIVQLAGGLVVHMLKSVMMLVGALALFDFIYQRRAFLKRMRMSLQEIKDEHKEAEGDPKIKAKIRSIAIQRSRRRMMAAVPKASVVICNPTHYAVALKYDHGEMSAPVVVAMGVDSLALKIREVATAANVPLVENKPLARALYASAEIDQPIPIEHYAAVAEVIGYVMALAKRRA